MSYLAISASFEYVCYGSTAILIFVTFLWTSDSDQGPWLDPPLDKVALAIFFKEEFVQIRRG